MCLRVAHLPDPIPGGDGESGLALVGVNGNASDFDTKVHGILGWGSGIHSRTFARMLALITCTTACSPRLIMAAP